MVRTSERIAGATVVPMAFRGRPPLITVGVREPYALRAIVEITTGSGVSGVGETYGGTVHPERLRRAADEPAGMDVGGLDEPIAHPSRAPGADPTDGDGTSGRGAGSTTTDRVRAPGPCRPTWRAGRWSGRRRSTRRSSPAPSRAPHWTRGGPARPTRRAGRPSTTCRTS